MFLFDCCFPVYSRRQASRSLVEQSSVPIRCKCCSSLLNHRSLPWSRGTHLDIVLFPLTSWRTFSNGTTSEACGTTNLPQIVLVLSFRDLVMTRRPTNGTSSLSLGVQFHIPNALHDRWDVFLVFFTFPLTIANDVYFTNDYCVTRHSGSASRKFAWHDSLWIIYLSLV